MAQSGVWSQGDSSRIVVPAVFPGEEEEEAGREEGQQQDLLPIAARGCGGWKSLPAPSPDCPARVGDKKEPGMVKMWLFLLGGERWDGDPGKMLVNGKLKRL